jgi:hypothetical protein
MLFAVSLILGTGGALSAFVCCTAPDNGTGTVTFPADCPYDHLNEPMMIVEGLPPGTTIILEGPLKDFYNVVNTPGGDLGGEVCTFDAFFEWTATGTGYLAGFTRYLYVPVTGEIHIGPRNPGDPVQTFDTRIVSLTGELFGDPDFCVLRITAGETHGLPCPGRTTLTDFPYDEFEVESFFDVTYSVEFEGCPGSILDGLAGVTTDMVPRTTCFDTTYTVDWCNLQWPHVIEEYPGVEVTVYGRLYIAGLTDQTTGNDIETGLVRGQVGYGPPGSDPSAGSGWTWTEAGPNPGWDGGAAGEPNNDEYQGVITMPSTPGEYDYCFRFSGDGGSVWYYGDTDGSQNGYQTAQAGKMTVGPVCCVAPDNGTGTATFPADCDYDHLTEPMRIVEGLPPASELILEGPLTDFFNVSEVPGGDLGGKVSTFNAYLDLTVTGTGSLAGFTRQLYVPVAGEVHTGPRNPGEPVQVFETKLESLAGELFGDPDFCTFRVTAGDANGMPCPGQTTLTELPSGDFNVESFFDIIYEIEFEGCPGSQLDGLVGTTRDSLPRTTCFDTTYTVDWCRLQWPETVVEYEGSEVTVYGRLYIAGLTDLTTGNDPVTAVVRGQVGYGPDGTDPSANPGLWTWTEAVPNPGYDGGTAGEPANDEYWAAFAAPGPAGHYDYCCRFSGDAGATWLYGDLPTGTPGEDGSENGYQVANAGQMTSIPVCCQAPDNGTGTIDFPPDCPYDHEDDPMMIIDGLPPATTLELEGPLTDFAGVVNVPGGTLGGEICTFTATLEWTVTGTGDLAGFNRSISMPVEGEIHIGPRNPGKPRQSFAGEIYSLQGELFGDPDFCTLRFTAGSDHGLPGPGQTVLTELPNGDFAVDSFFDITYEIEFEGCPGSQLDGFAGTTTDQVRRATCWQYAGVDRKPDLPEPAPDARAWLAPVRPNPFGASTAITYGLAETLGYVHTSVRIYDASGRLVRTLVDADLGPGTYGATWDGKDDGGKVVASGVYFCRLSSGGAGATRRIVYLK